MEHKILRISGDEWSEKYATEAHLLAFSQDRSKSMDRTTFALLYIVDEVPYMYMSCHEMDETSVYVQFGGTFRPEEKKPYALRAYTSLIGMLLTTYERVATKIANTNTAMLRPAMRVGFRIDGVSYFKGVVYLEHMLERGFVNG